MYLYIDETGPFDTPRGGGHSLCAVGSLAIPESCHQIVLDGFATIVSEWHLSGAEPKGRILTEGKFDRFFTFLSSFDVVLTLVAIDMGLHTDAQISDHKARQVARMRESVEAPIFFQSMRDSVNELADRLADLSNPLYVQSVLLTTLLGRALQTATLHYAQTDPAALGAFRWRIDAKDIRLTPGEQLWKDIIKPMAQSYFLKHPLITVTEFDYSAMAPFENPVRAEAPDYLRPGIPQDLHGQFRSFDARKLIETDMAFLNSQTAPGLNLVDIAVSAFRRACQGTLQERGWRGLPRLIVRDLEHNAAVQYAQLGPDGAPPRRTRVPYANVYRALEVGSRRWDVRPR